MDGPAFRWYTQAVLVFDRMDLTGDRILTLDELMLSCRRLGFSEIAAEREAHRMMARAAGGQGRLGVVDFVGLLRDQLVHGDELVLADVARLQQAFDLQLIGGRAQACDAHSAALAFDRAALRIFAEYDRENKGRVTLQDTIDVGIKLGYTEAKAEVAGRQFLAQVAEGARACASSIADVRAAGSSDRMYFGASRGSAEHEVKHEDQDEDNADSDLELKLAGAPYTKQIDSPLAHSGLRGPSMGLTQLSRSPVAPAGANRIDPRVSTAVGPVPEGARPRRGTMPEGPNGMDVFFEMTGDDAEEVDDGIIPETTAGDTHEISAADPSMQSAAEASQSSMHAHQDQGPGHTQPEMDVWWLRDGVDQEAWLLWCRHVVGGTNLEALKSIFDLSLIP